MLKSSAELNEMERSILEYMEMYPSFFFRSTMLSRKLGVPAQKISKTLLILHITGRLEKLTRGSGKTTRSYYKIPEKRSDEQLGMQ